LPSTAGLGRVARFSDPLVVAGVASRSNVGVLDGVGEGLGDDADVVGDGVEMTLLDATATGSGELHPVHTARLIATGSHSTAPRRRPTVIARWR